MKRLLRLLPALLFSLVAGCDSDSPETPFGVTAPVSRVIVQPQADTLELRPGATDTDSLRLAAAVVGFSGSDITSTTPVRWSSADTTIATVDSAGVVRGRGAGTTTVTARAGGREARATIVVVQLQGDVRITTSVTEAQIGDTVRLAAGVVDAAGQPVPAPAATWTSSDPTVATIDAATGLATFLRAGTVRFTATVAGVGTATTGVITVIERQYTSVATGYDGTCSTLTTGEAFCWGRGAEGQVGAPLDTVCYDQEDAVTRRKACSLAPKRTATPVRFANVAAGGLFSCGVATTGRAYCWGLDTLGQLGGGRLTSASTPQLVTSIVNFTQISAGGAHACGLTTVQTAFCWGWDVFGQLGNVGLLYTSTTPIAVDGELRFRNISAGALHTCGTTTDGRVFCWGSNRDGRTGTPTVKFGTDTGVGPVVDAPQQVPLPGPATQAVASWGGLALGRPSGVSGAGATFVGSVGGHSCALVSGTAYCWGSNRFRELGTGSAADTVFAPAAVPGVATFTQLAAGDGFTCGLADGRVFCWGRNDFGQTGASPVTPTAIVPAPREVATPIIFDPSTGLGVATTAQYVSITAGRRHACARATDGSVYCWGSDVMGALGSQQQQLVQPRPVRVSRPL